MIIRLLERFKKSYRDLPLNIQDKVDKALTLLAENPRHPSLQVRKLESAVKIWYLRIDRNYRLTFEIQDGDIFVLRHVDKHDDALKNP